MFTGIIETTAKIITQDQGTFSVACDFVDELCI
jgi:riboflavin synthase alpha subunit